MTDPDPVERLRPGMRAVVRHRIAPGPTDPSLTEPSLTDALGDVVAMDAVTVSVRTRRGLVVIDRDAVVAAKEVPPRPTRRGAPHLAISMDDLEQVMVEGWPPLERAELGGWLLRAAAGFTARANSVLPVGSPGVPLSEAIDRCESWYDERGLRHAFSLFGPAGFALKDDPLGQELVGRGYEPFNHTVVLTTSTTDLPNEVPHAVGARVRLEFAPSALWWDAWTGLSGHASTDTATAQAVMTGSPEQLFATLEVGGEVIGIARVGFARAWAGVSALHVAQGHRRTGVAGQLMGAIADASRARGIRSMYVQVAQANSPAQALYDGLGFSTHHEYRYLGR